MSDITKDQLVVITKHATGDCGMFHVEAGTIAKVIALKGDYIKVAVTPHDKGFITLYETSMRNLTCDEIKIAMPLFLEVPRFTFKVAKLY
jgi:hypothetical protein